MRAVLETALASARKDGLPLCAAPDVGLEDLPATRPLLTPMLRVKAGVDCVPFTALPALAADHSDSTSELRTVLTGSKGRELTTAAVYEWKRFLETLRRAPKAPLERMSFVHELDVAFYFLDPGYELRAQKTRSHFVASGRRIEDVVRDAGNAGAVDNAVAQLLVHHLRSLALAARGDVTEALLEHGFAVHFLEDSFASGHLVMTDRLWSFGNTRARSRHDFFDASGLPVRRALGAESCADLEQSFEGGLSPCWTTWGDGYLGTARDSSDRAHVVQSVKKAQIQLAMALDAGRVRAYFDGLGEREQIAFGGFFDPAPWWTIRRTDRKTRPATAAYAKRLVAASADAVELLKKGEVIRKVFVGMQGAGSLFGANIVATAADPCSPAPPDADPDDACAAGHVLALGTLGASFVRPLLVDLPASDADPDRLEGSAPTDHGLAFQLLAETSVASLFPNRAPVDMFAPALGGSLGLAYRFGTYLPGRRNRAAFEINTGVSSSIHYDVRGKAGGHPLVTRIDQEVRFPILWEGLTSYVLPLDLVKSKTAGSVIALGGVRVHEVLDDPTPRFFGVDVEVVAVALSYGTGAYPLYSVSPELRLHVGYADAGIVQPGLAGMWGPTISVTLAGGYATLF